MFRRVGRTHTGGGKTWWPTGCGIHQRRCSAYLLRSRLFYRSPCTRVHRHEGEREKRVRARGGKRDGEGGDWLYEKNSPLKLSMRKEPPPCRLPLRDPLRSYEESSGGIYTFFTPESRTQRIIAGLCLIMRGAARPAIYKAART